MNGIKTMKRFIILYFSILTLIACTSSESVPPEDATPEFIEVKYEAGVALDKGYATLSARLTTDNGITVSGFMIGRDEVDLAFFKAGIENCSFSVRVDNLETETEYCFYARVGNGLNEIRTRLIRFKTGAAGTSGTEIPDKPDNPGEDPGNSGEEPDNPGTGDPGEEPDNPGTGDSGNDNTGEDNTGKDNLGDPILPPDGVGITISDPLLLQYLLRLYDSDADGKLVNEEAEAVETISVCADGITTLDGVQYFRNLKSLDCCGSVWNGSLASLALNRNTALEVLKCSYNQLTSISLPSSLIEMECRFNKFQTLNLSGVPHLKRLDCFGNRLENLDLSGLPELESLTAGMNSFRTLDVSGNPNLKVLDLSDSPDLEILYVAKGQRIEEMSVEYNVQIKYKE